MRFKRSTWKRKAISGIIAGILFFALVFTTGLGFLLFVNNLNGQFDRAQQQSQVFNTQRIAEAATVHPYGSATINATIVNNGSVPFGIVAAFLANSSGALVPNGGMLTTAKIVSPVKAGFSAKYPYAIDTTAEGYRATLDTGFKPVAGMNYTVGIITKSGNVFTARYIARAFANQTEVSPVIAGLVTDLNSSVVFPGSSVFDQAKLSAVTPKATGTVSFYYYMPSSAICSGSAVPAGSAQVLNGVVQGNSSTVLFTTPGLYSWNAVYSGDPGNNAVTSTCEPLLVTTASGIRTEVITTLSASFIVPPDSVFDQSTLTGATATAGGTVSYYYYPASGVCAGLRNLVSQVTVVNGTVPNSASVLFSLAGAYSWIAVYSGDGSNSPATSPCEPLLATSSSIQPSIVTTLSASVIVPGGSVFDQATLAGTTNAAGGTVTYNYFPNAVCSGTAVPEGSVDVINGVVQGNSNTVPFNTTGRFSWNAVYSGDANNGGAVSACEPLLVSETFVPVLVTTLSANIILPGGSVFDQATLAGVTFDARGNVTFYRYSTPTCSGSRVLVSTSAVAGGRVASNSSSVPFPVAGSFSWIAVYSGDANNNPATSSCEPLQVSLQFVRAVLTTLSANVVQPGASVFDQATLAGVTTHAGGHLAYYYYQASGICAGAPTLVSNVTVIDGAASSSASVVFGSPGVYSWIAVYGGDPNNVPMTSPCEPLSVLHTFPPRVVTALSSVVVSPGASVFDQATLAGVTSDAGGSLTYYYYPSSGVCIGARNQVAQAAVVNGEAANSSGVVFNTAGSFSWIAVYSGDANNAPATSACEPLSVEPVSIRAIFTTLSSNTITPGNSVHDQATLAGVTNTASGTVTYYRFSDGACSAGQTQVGSPVAVTNGVVPDSAAVAFSNAGSYSWNAVYSGDASNAGATSPCEPLLVSQTFLPAFTTTLSANVITPGNSVYDQATLEGVTSNAGGTVTYYYYSSSGTCGSGQTQVGSPVTVTNGVVPQSASQAFATAGAFSWKAVYSGDANNSPATSPCEPLLVMQTFIPAFSTVLSANVIPPGSSVFDQAELQGVTSNAGGTVTYYYYATSGVCASGQTQVGSPVAVTNGVVPNSASVTFNNNGAFSWRAVYSGDANNAAATSPCEPLLVSRVFIDSFVTTLSSSVILPGGSVFDQGTLTGVTTTAGGTVSYYYYPSSGVCSGSRTLVSTVNVTNGQMPNSASVQFNTAGYYSWNAVYSGDANNAGVTSPCEPLTVSETFVRSTVTTLSASVINPGGSVYDQSTLTGVTSDAAGTVTYYRYSDGLCSAGQTQVGSPVTVTNGVVPNSASVSYPNSGSYSWKAVYSGDGNNVGGGSACEPLLVLQTLITSFTTTLSSNVILPGSSVFDQATLEGVTSNAGGTVTYYRYTDGICSAGQTQVGSPVTVTNGVVPNSASVQFNTYGAYSWKGVYSGDANNAAANSPCEPLFVTNSNSKTGVISTLSVNAATPGSTVFDQSTLIGVTPGAAGTVSYYTYSNGLCSAGQSAVGTPVTVTSGSVPNSIPVTFDTVGSFSWNAVYSGDSNNGGATSPCEPLLIQAGLVPVIITSLSSSVVTPGNTASDQAILVGVSGSAGGTVTYTAYLTSGTCSGANRQFIVTVTNGNVPKSGSVEYNLTGSYSWKATYSGDSNNNPATSTCEPLTVFTLLPANSLNSLTTQGIGFIGFNFDHFVAYDMGACDVLSKTASSHLGCASPAGKTSPWVANQYSGYAVNPNNDYYVFLALLTNVDPSGRSIVLIPPTTTAVGGGSERSTGGSAFVEFDEPVSGGGNVASWPYSLITAVNESSGAACGTTLVPCLEPLRDSSGNPLNGGGIILPPLTCYDQLNGLGNIVPCASASALSVVPHPTWVYFAAAFNPGLGGSREPGTSSQCASPCVVGNFFYLEGLVGGHAYGQNIAFSTTVWSTQTMSSTSLSCVPASLAHGVQTTCTATVSGTTPSGTVLFATTQIAGTSWTPAASCTLALSGGVYKCSVQYTQSIAGTPTITAAYSGDANNLASGGQVSVTFT